MAKPHRPGKQFDRNDIVRLLKAAVEREGGQTAFAKRHRVHRSSVNRVLKGKLPVGDGPIKPGRRGKRLPATASSTPRLTQRKRPTKEMMRAILQSWTKRAALPKLLPLRSPDTTLTPTC
jgi:hypothetical protein